MSGLIIARYLRRDRSLKHHPPMTPDMDGVKIAPGDDPHGNREIAR
jgi:hypothetical protein